MSAIASFRTLQPHLTTRLVARSSPGLNITRAVRQQRATALGRGFATSPARRSIADPGPNGNPQLPKFNLKDLVSNPRTRRILIVLLVGLACIESAAYYTFLPKMMGWDKKEEGKEGDAEKKA